jgi:outer membrane receptor protein involved in Fe transport
MNRFFTSHFKAGFEHRFDETSSLLIDASYGTDVFNYQSPIGGLGYTDKQHNDLMDVSIELTPYSFDKFGLGASAEFTLFNQKYVTSLVDKAKEVALSGTLTPSYQFNDDVSIDLEACIDYTNYPMTGFGNATTFDFTPHLYWKNDVVDLKAGVYVDNDLHIAPDVNATFHMNSRFDIYLQAEGGRVYNDFKSFAQMTPYWCLDIADGDFNDQFDQLRAQGGIRMQPIDGLYADLSAGYDISKDRAEIADFLMDRTTNCTYAPIMFADGKYFFVNANIKYDYRNQFMIDLNGRYNHWSTDYKPTGYIGINTTNWNQILWRPQLELDCSIRVQPIERLTIGADFLFESFQNKTNRYERPNTLDLGATISYTFPFRLTLYAKGDNLLNKKYDHYMMYRSPGINFLAGAAITF